ncbi:MULTISPECIES: MarC family protein [unclassified Polaribacter]|jgi:multiple antibiotic resistance protein|uniref:MarC family protein n=1 Tax=unclassified Polaribacter TaxID=196858 RepID=UPI001C4F2A78|nr:MULTISPECIES: MarC family protein [unclassified Polaribacter]QXP62096.1 MarC family protein [Polaribacter sp. HaHaR_3_91]QXP67847.1 MarC family protein [Polaribacter sp. AHE13PA]QXP70013.1 MarC family protein [Polaribacter sp. R2A056_3_33]
MDNLITFAITVFTGFFAITNPISNMTVFVSLTRGLDKETKRDINKRSNIIAFVIVTVFVLLGKYIFELFNISVPAFKITGGILIFYIGFEMLQSKKSDVKNIKNVDVDEDIAVSPLAIPILAGPGTIVTAMNFVANVQTIHIILVIVIFGTMSLITFYTFRLSDLIVKVVGNNVISVIGKIMGLIIAIIGTGMVITGIKISFDLITT